MATDRSTMRGAPSAASPHSFSGSNPQEIQEAAEIGASGVRPTATPAQAQSGISQSALNELKRVQVLLSTGTAPGQKEAAEVIRTRITEAAVPTESFEQT